MSLLFYAMTCAKFPGQLQCLCLSIYIYIYILFFVYGFDHEVYTKKERKILALNFSVTSIEEYASMPPEKNVSLQLN
jgi:hypothetical protein